MERRRLSGDGQWGQLSAGPLLGAAAAASQAQGHHEPGGGCLVCLWNTLDLNGPYPQGSADANAGGVISYRLLY